MASFWDECFYQTLRRKTAGQKFDRERDTLCMCFLETDKRTLSLQDQTVKVERLKEQCV